MKHRDFWQNTTGSPVVKPLHFQCRGVGSIPDGGSKVLHSMRHSEKSKEKKKAKHITTSVKSSVLLINCNNDCEEVLGTVMGCYRGP